MTPPLPQRVGALAAHHGNSLRPGNPPVQQAPTPRPQPSPAWSSMAPPERPSLGQSWWWPPRGEPCKELRPANSRTARAGSCSPAFPATWPTRLRREVRLSRRRLRPRRRAVRCTAPAEPEAGRLGRECQSDHLAPGHDLRRRARRNGRAGRRRLRARARADSTPRTRRAGGGPATATDDRGAYRLSGLSPGRYVIQVPSVQASVPAATTIPAARGNAPDGVLEADDTTRLVVGRYPIPPPRVDGRPMAYPAAFHPATQPSPRRRGRTGIRRGSRTTSTWALRPCQGAASPERSAGPPDALINLTLRLLQAGLEDLGVGSEVATALVGTGTGRFTFVNVPAGSYVIDAPLEDQRTLHGLDLPQRGLPCAARPGRLEPDERGHRPRAGGDVQQHGLPRRRGEFFRTRRGRGGRRGRQLASPSRSSRPAPSAA